MLVITYIVNITNLGNINYYKTLLIIALKE